jgi:hypothetical protein
MTFRATSLGQINYELIRNNKWGRLMSPVETDTRIAGYSAKIDEGAVFATLEPNGLLFIGTGTEWDFGSGPAVNTPEMVRASLVHDMMCHFTDRGLIPWSCRHKADKLFLSHLDKYGRKRAWYSPLRYWKYVRFTGVVCYSQLIARWRAK